VEIRVPHVVEYIVPQPPSVSDVIQSLQGAERVFLEIRQILEGCVDGIDIERIDIRVSQITHSSPLREVIFGVIFLTFQKDLEKEVRQLSP
jgi:hypothetical protein